MKVSSNPVYTFKASTSKDFVAFFDKIDAVDDNIAIITDIYPNPSNSMVFIEGLNIKEIAIFNTLGQIVIRQENNNDYIVKINIESLEKGVYFIMINGISTRRIVKE